MGKEKVELIQPELDRGQTIKQYYAQTFSEAYKPGRGKMYKKKKRTKIFLSHPNAHREVTQKIHDLSDYLKKKKEFCPWCDKDHLGTAGQTLTKKLIGSMIQALEESDVTLVGAPGGNVSSWIIAECKQAKTMKKKIVVVIFGTSKHKPGLVASVPDGIIQVEKDDETWMEKVCEAIRKVMNQRTTYEDL